jgi:hypothetical protein
MKVMFKVIYKSELYDVFDMTDRCYIARKHNESNRGRYITARQVWLPKKDCEVV